MSEQTTFDVIVVGGGNAGLLAAIAAREAGRPVLLIEVSPPLERGGNNRFASGVFRVADNGAVDLRPLVPDETALPWDRIEIAQYPADRFLREVMESSPTCANPVLLRYVASQSLATVRWMREHGVRWATSTAQLSESTRNGKTVRLSPGSELMAEGTCLALMETVSRAAEEVGVTVSCSSPVADLLNCGRTVEGVLGRTDEVDKAIRAPVTILASGEFETSAEARVRYLGPNWDLVRVRGSRYNTGVLLEKAISHTAGSAGHWSAAHAVPTDAMAPAVGDLAVGDSTACHSYPYGITVNWHGERFLDEGEDELQFTYGEMDRKVLTQPSAAAYQIFDNTGCNQLEPRYTTGAPAEADTIEELAAAAGIDPARPAATIRYFNAACPEGRLQPSAKDGLCTEPGGQPPKSNWAVSLTKPPHRAYRVTCGITVTFGGLAVDAEARVLGPDARPIPGLLAAGEVAGGFFAYNLPSGSGLIRGAVGGLTAGQTAARMTGVQS